MSAKEPKTKVEQQSVEAYIDTLSPPDRRAEARRLVTIFTEVTGYQPLLHPGGMIGFGRYCYTYDSGHSGTSLATGFAPRKAELSLYLNAVSNDFEELRGRLGKHRSGKACLYLKRLDDADETALRELIAAALAALKTRWPVTPA